MKRAFGPRLLLIFLGVLSASLTHSGSANAASDCLDLAGYLANIRAMPDSLFMHHQLANLTLKGASDIQAPSDLATQRALDLFYHPNLVTLGLAAGKNGGSYLHHFSAYQMDCAKVVTGDIFATEGMSIIWEVAAHSGTQLTLKRLSSGGKAEVASGLTLAMRMFRTLGPASFSVTSAYKLVTEHGCGPVSTPTEVDETNTLLVTELFTIDSSVKDPQEAFSDGLKTLMAKYPRVSAPTGRRGDFINPVTPETDSTCAAQDPGKTR